MQPLKPTIPQKSLNLELLADTVKYLPLVWAAQMVMLFSGARDLLQQSPASCKTSCTNTWASIHHHVLLRVFSLQTLPPWTQLMNSEWSEILWEGCSAQDGKG